MGEPDEEEKPASNSSRRTLADADFRPRHPLEQDSQSYSTVTDLARLRGWSTFAPRFTAM